MPANTFESLESRQLFATLPANFSETFVTRVVTNVAATMTFAPDGRLFVGDTTNGQIRLVKNGVLQSTPALTLGVDRFGERGINGLALAPNFGSAPADEKYVYIYYTRSDPANPNVQNNNAKNRLSRFAMSTSNPDLINPASELVLLDNLDSTTGRHNGGMLKFDAAGFLYLGLGDNGTSSNSQSLANLYGKILRLNVADPANLIPADNPFVNTQGARGEIWALGIRNPFTGDIKTGINTLFVNDVGGSQFEEVNNITKGGNYGWPTTEGVTSNPSFISPIHAYPHGTSAAVTGGAFYFGNELPSSYVGDYFFADYIKKTIWTLDPANGNQVATFATNTLSIVDIDVSPIDGSLWTLELGGNIHKITYNQVPPPPPPPPPPPAQQTPFKGSPFAVGNSPVTIQAEDFDNGGEGVAYHDVNASNLGGAYRSTGVDIQATTDSGGGHNLAYVKAGEWLEYTINVATSGNYDFAFRVASAGANGKFHFEIDGASKGQLTIPNTAGWQNWTTVNKTSVALTSGQHVLRVFMDVVGATGSVGNFNHITIKPTSTSTTKTLRPTQDTYVHDKTPTTNFGTSTSLLVKKYNTGYNRETYLKFDLSTASTINSAKLRLYGGFEYAPGKNVRLAVYSVDPATWSEGTLTYNTRPNSSGPLATITINNSTKSYKEWNLTAFLKAEKAAGRNLVSFVIRALDTSNPLMTFNSDESTSNQPQLAIT